AAAHDLPVQPHATARTGSREPVQSRQVGCRVLAREIADELPVDDHTDRVRVVRVLRLGKQNRPARMADGIAAKAADDLPERFLVVRLADYFQRLATAEDRRVESAHRRRRLSTTEKPSEKTHALILTPGSRGRNGADRHGRACHAAMPGANPSIEGLGAGGRQWYQESTGERTYVTGSTNVSQPVRPHISMQHLRHLDRER